MELIQQHIVALFKKPKMSDKMVILIDEPSRLAVMAGLSNFSIEKCTGEYCLVEGRNVWVKTVTSTIPKGSYQLEICIFNSLTEEERKGLKKWQKNAI